MAESLHHTQLVQDLISFIANQYFNGDKKCLLRDSAGTEKNHRCYEINDFIPDVIGCSLVNPDRIIIGEAKTEKDIENRHTLMQFDAFVRYCASKNNGSLLIIAVPWFYHRRVRQMVSKIEGRLGLSQSLCVVPEMFRG